MPKQIPRNHIVGRPRGSKIASNTHPYLSISGITTLVHGNAGTLTLSVGNNPLVNPYNGFAEVTDADGIASIVGSTVTISSSAAVGTHSITYKATSSGGNPDISKTITITITAVSVPSSGDNWLWEDGTDILFEDSTVMDLEEA
jgi:hypothetical protein